MEGLCGREGEVPKSRGKKKAGLHMATRLHLTSVRSRLRPRRRQRFFDGAGFGIVLLLVAQDEFVLFHVDSDDVSRA